MLGPHDVVSSCMWLLSSRHSSSSTCNYKDCFPWFSFQSTDISVFWWWWWILLIAGEGLESCLPWALRQELEAKVKVSFLLSLRVLGQDQLLHFFQMFDFFHSSPTVRRSLNTRCWIQQFNIVKLRPKLQIILLSLMFLLYQRFTWGEISKSDWVCSHKRYTCFYGGRQEWKSDVWLSCILACF